DYSIELCGGCHVRNSAEIGLFKIVSESGIGAGTRRIEAVTSKGAYEYVNNKEQILQTTAHALKVKEEQVPERVNQLFKVIKEERRQMESLRSKLAQLESVSILEEVQEINGVSLLAKKVDVSDMNQLRQMVDDMKQKLKSGIILLASVNNDKVQLSAGVTKDLIDQGYHAGNLIKEAATICGGGDRKSTRLNSSHVKS